MRTKTAFVATTAMIALLGALPACANHPARTLTQEVPTSGARRIHLDFPVGDLTVVAADQATVSVEVKLECEHGGSRCAEAAEKVEIRASGADPLRIELAGWPKLGTRGLRANARIRVPRSTPLMAELGVGDLRVSGLEADLRAHLGVGDVAVTAPEARVASVHLGTGVGDATLRTSRGRDEGNGFIGHKVTWKGGAGQAAIRVDCGVGDATVVLK
jgi:hypothetical protein